AEGGSEIEVSKGELTQVGAVGIADPDICFAVAQGHESDVPSIRRQAGTFGEDVGGTDLSGRATVFVHGPDGEIAGGFGAVDDAVRGGAEALSADDGVVRELPGIAAVGVGNKEIGIGGALDGDDGGVVGGDAKADGAVAVEIVGDAGDVAGWIADEIDLLVGLAELNGGIVGDGAAVREPGDATHF